MLLSFASYQAKYKSNAWFTPATFRDFCCLLLVILSHSVCDFGSVISVDFFSVISDFGRHRDNQCK